MLFGKRHLKDEGAYFKEKGINTMKFQNFEIFLLKITKNNYLYSVTCFKITSYFHIFIVHTCSIGALNLL